jgi:hypothetical protein
MGEVEARRASGEGDVAKLVAILFLAFLFLILPTTAYASHYSADVRAWPSLIGYWRFTDPAGSSTAADSSRHGLDGTIHGTIRFGEKGLVTGAGDTSALFDGHTYVSLPEGALAFDWNTPFLIEFVLKVPPAGTPMSGSIIGKELQGESRNGWNLYVSGYQGAYQIELLMRSAAGFYQLRRSTKTTVFTPGSVHHVALAYGGTGRNQDAVFYVDGDRVDTIDYDANLGNHSIANPATAAIGGNIGFNGPPGPYFNGFIQELAVYGEAAPAGSLNIAFGNVINNLAWYHAQLAHNDQPPIANPPAKPNVFYEDDWSDADALGDLRWAIHLHRLGLINLVGVANNAASPYAPSMLRAILDYWHLENIPVLAYQGGEGPDDRGGISHTTAQKFRPQDEKDVGVLNAGTAIKEAGKGFVAGDVLPIPGGTLAPGFKAATFTVDTVDGEGRIISGRISNAGSYGTAPSSPAALANPHGGEPAAITFSTGNLRGNYTDFMSGLQDILRSHNKVYVVNTGVAFADADFVKAYPELWNSKVAAIILCSGFAPSSAYWGMKGGEYNFVTSPAAWNAFLAKSTVPVVQYGDENTNPPNAPPAGNIVMGPHDYADENTDPIEWAFKRNLFAPSPTRPSWSAGAWIWLAYGIAPRGTGYQAWVYWAANGGTLTIDPSNGMNTWSPKPGNAYYIRRRASDADYNALMAKIMAEKPEGTASSSN